MLDLTLRPLKDEALRRPAQLIAPHVRPAWLTAVGLGATLFAAALVWSGYEALAVAAWLFGRVLDGLDGLVARIRDEVADFGAYLDIVADTVGYAVVPLAVAAAHGQTAGWVVAAVLLAAFYLNAVSWTYLAALLEKRGRGASSTGESTSVTMPPAIVEGAETIAFFTLFLAVPASLPVFGALMAGLVVVGVGQRVRVARGLA